MAKLEAAKESTISLAYYIFDPFDPDQGKIYKEAGTTNTYVLRWKLWDKETRKKIKEYRLNWNYRTSDGITYDVDGNDRKIVAKNQNYDQCNPPDNAVQLLVQIKMVAEKHKVNGKDVKYFSDVVSPWLGPIAVGAAATSDRPEDNVPGRPSAPTVKISGNKLTASVLYQDPKAQFVEFEFFTNNGLYSLGIQRSGSIVYLLADPKYGSSGGSAPGDNQVNVPGYYVSEINIAPGKAYLVRCRGVNVVQGTIRVEGEWSDYSNEKDGIAVPAWPTDLGSVLVGGSNIKAKAFNETSVKITWPIVPTGAEDITIEYAEEKEYFDTSGNTRTLTVKAKAPYAIVTGLATGEDWFFRAKASNSAGDSPWSEIISAIIGTIPAAPTTWSSRAVIKTGEENILYWTHNSKDESSERGAKIKIYENGTLKEEIYVEPPSVEGELNEYHFKTTEYLDDTEILWSVRTRGILDEPDGGYGPSSIQRSFKVLTPSKAYLKLMRGSKWFWDPFNFTTDDILTAYGELADPIPDGEALTKYPIYIGGFTEPKGHVPIDAYFSITALETYQGLDSTGEEIWISAGEEVFSNIPDLRKMLDTDTGKVINLVLMPSNIYLMNGIRYNIHFTVTMSNGLTAEADLEFTIDMPLNVGMLNAALSYDETNVSVELQPYCLDENGEPMQDVVMSVYRKDFDGRFVELATGLKNFVNHHVLDPHPPLDFARYRVVGIDSFTGSIFFYDTPGYPIPETAIVIQWDERWKNFATSRGEEASETDTIAIPSWIGSILKLPYNVDVADSTDTDTELVEYIGREHPVSYYGTHVDYSSTWNTLIPVNDKETMYQIRRLSRFMGDCYVREPNGSGYWAHITLSWSVTHKEMGIPVTITIKRVEGDA